MSDKSKDECFLEDKIKRIILNHLKGMVADIQWELLISVDNFEDIICDVYADTLFQCFQPLIKMKLGVEENA